MAALTISAERVQQIEKILTDFLVLCPASAESSEAAGNLLDILHPHVEWYDHAFLIRRVGHEAVLGLQKAFTHCNQPFEARLQVSSSTIVPGKQHNWQKEPRTEIVIAQAVHPSATGGVLEQTWHGRCSNDIVRPDGQVAVKANGREFVCHVCMVMKIDLEGRITRIDEYYTKIWADGIPDTQYTVMKGPSLKSSKLS